MTLRALTSPKLYIFADKYLITDLKVFCLHGLFRELGGRARGAQSNDITRAFVMSEDFPALLRFVLKNTSDNADPMRILLAWFTVSQLDLAVENESFRQLVIETAHWDCFWQKCSVRE